MSPASVDGIAGFVLEFLNGSGYRRLLYFFIKRLPLSRLRPLRSDIAYCAQSTVIPSSSAKSPRAKGHGSATHVHSGFWYTRLQSSKTYAEYSSPPLPLHGNASASLAGPSLSRHFCLPQRWREPLQGTKPSPERHAIVPYLRTWLNHFGTLSFSPSQSRRTPRSALRLAQNENSKK